MSMNWKDRWSIGATMVADAFIDEYMAGANGEYVKVYLYILRHQGEELTVESIADALDHTESDVRRAVSYWEKLGILSGAENEKKQELLEYLVEYCAQNGHSSVRYLETVAVSWHEKGIKTSQEARELGAAYSKDSFAVMRAFGINNRKAAPPEQAMIDKWFKEYGFAREIVLEACSRTITAIHSPSFQYADRILRDWKKAGVKKMEDVRALDARRQALVQENGGDKEKRLQRYNSASKDGGGKKNSQNQFHNFKQRDTDYDALMLKQVKEWVGGGRPRT